MRKTVPGIALLVCLSLALPVSAQAAANTSESRTATQPAITRFSTAFLDAFWQQNPDWAIRVGYYRYADRLPIPNAATRAAQLRFADEWLRHTALLEGATLPPQQRTDLALIRSQLESQRWYLNEFREWEWNPSEYNVAESFSLLLNTPYAPLEQRLRVIAKRLRQVPAYYAAARASLRKPTLEHTQLAIAQSQGVLDVFGDGFDKAVVASALSKQEKAQLGQLAAKARTAVADYASWLKQLEPQLVAGKGRSFRIGKAAFEAKFRHDIQTDLTAEQLYQRALEEKARLHQRMGELADTLWPKYMAGVAEPASRLEKIRLLIDAMSARHIAPADLLPEIKRQLPVLAQWVSDHQLVELDPSRPLQVRETPVYMRGIAGASISAPGPYDPTANTYYNVTPLDGYTPEQAESYLREYNEWILQVLNIHEAIPGHYVQLLNSNKSPSPIKSVFGNGAMIEGWAVYSERMMLESGYGGNTPEMWLMYSKWNLRAVCNTIVDYAVHVQDMSEQQVLDLLKYEAFQSDTEARGKWRRATLSSVQLSSYFAGYAAIYDFRERLKAAQGEQFNLKRFHDEFLSYGSAPVGMIKSLMQARP
ncbi:DUF885 domain-containing protein [Chitinimonas naiadis]